MTRGSELSVPRPDVPAFAILALTPEQIRMLSVYPRVPFSRDGAADPRAWARMVDLPLARVRELARGLEDIGATMPRGELHATIRAYLTKLARDRLT